VDRGQGNNEAVAEQLHDVAGDLVYFQNDGSVETGFEIISNPMTLTYWQDHARKHYKRMSKVLNNCGYASHNTSTCGLHIHASCAGLGEFCEDRYITIGRILAFMQKFEKELFTFSRRSSNNIRTWARFKRYLAAHEEDDMRAAEIVAKYYDDTRYQALNLMNRHTIEFRFNKGTLNVDTITASLELIHAIILFARSYTLKEGVNKLGDFTDFIDIAYTNAEEHGIAYSECLREYAIKRRLYIPLKEQVVNA
jgi:hypothetical protein